MFFYVFFVMYFVFFACVLEFHMIIGTINRSLVFVLPVLTENNVVP